MNGQVEKPKASAVVVPDGPAPEVMFPGVKTAGGVRVKAFVDPAKADELARWLDWANRRG